MTFNEIRKELGKRYNTSTLLQDFIYAAIKVSGKNGATIAELAALVETKESIVSDIIKKIGNDIYRLDLTNMRPVRFFLKEYFDQNMSECLLNRYQPNNFCLDKKNNNYNVVAYHD